MLADGYPCLQLCKAENVALLSDALRQARCSRLALSHAASKARKPRPSWLWIQRTAATRVMVSNAQAQLRADQRIPPTSFCSRLSVHPSLDWAAGLAIKPDEMAWHELLTLLKLCAQKLNTRNPVHVEQDGKAGVSCQKRGLRYLLFWFRRFDGQ
jgi:hypothetical protein